MLHRNNTTIPPAAEAERLATAKLKENHLRDLGDQITELAAHLDAATFRWLELVREFDENGGWFGDGLKSCAHWLNWRCGMALGAARERLRVAHALHDLPLTRDAFRQGRLSYSKARAITRVATPGNESVLVDIALHGTAAHVERAVRGYRRVKRLEALQSENRRHALRELHWSSDPEGCIVLRGRFTPDEAAVIRQALDSAMDRIYEERKDVSAETSEAEQPASPAPLRAIPGLRGTSASVHNDPLPSPIAARRADALVRIAEAWLSGSEGTGSNADRFLVNVHTDVETLKADGSGAEAEIEDAGHVSAETSRRLACDGAVVHWLEGAGGEPLSVGRKTRTVPPAIRRSLQRRDGGCRFPGCSATRFVDAHHIHHWADGGSTHVDNLVLLCRHHHRLVHEGGFGLRREAGGELSFTTPHGRPIPAASNSRFRGNVLELFAGNDKAGIEVTPGTPIPRWLGEPMDDNLAVHHLLRRE